MSYSPNLTPRQIYQRNHQRRQNKVFAIVTMGLAIALAFGLLLLSGLIGLPFGNDFTQKEHFAEAGDIPCPSPDARPSDPATVEVQVLNGTTRPGIAGDATRILETLGYTVIPPENANRDYPGTVEISAGPAGVDHAWTVARIFPNARVTLTDATDARVYVTLGSFYDRPIDADEAKRASENDDPLEKPEKCFPVRGTGTDEQAQSETGPAEQSGTDEQPSGAEQPASQ